MRDSAEMLKEQLRNQGKEMQRREAEQAKNEAKIKHILKISQEKIEDLQHEVKSKEHEIEQMTRDRTPKIWNMDGQVLNKKTSKDLKPKKAILTNLHVDLDYSKLKKELPKNIIPAYDGLTFNF